MGMDVYGKEPQSETGKYFRNNVWWWRPLATYCEMCAPDFDYSHWGYNDGAGLNSSDAKKLADILQEEINSGRTEFYAAKYKREMDAIPDEICDLCGGTGHRIKPVPGKEVQLPMDGCNGCDGKGKVRPMQTWYPFTVKNVQEFTNFLKECGGFEIC